MQQFNALLVDSTVPISANLVNQTAECGLADAETDVSTLLICSSFTSSSHLSYPYSSDTIIDQQVKYTAQVPLCAFRLAEKWSVPVRSLRRCLKACGAYRESTLTSCSEGADSGLSCPLKTIQRHSAPRGIQARMPV